MSNPKHTQADFLQGARTLIENAIGIPEIAAVLAGYGYTQDRLMVGRRLWAEADSAAKKQALDSGSKTGSTMERDRAWEKANAAYAKALKVARVAFGDDARAIGALKLYGPRRQSLAGWLDQALTFYTNISVDSSLAAVLGRYGYDQARIAAEAALVEAVRAKAQEKTAGSGAAQASTASRDRKMRELDAWVSELRTIARVAFYEEPQELEKLGVMALNGPRRSKKAEAAAVGSGK
jgi:hypothetical protein